MRRGRESDRRYRPGRISKKGETFKKTTGEPVDRIEKTKRQGRCSRKMKKQEEKDEERGLKHLKSAKTN